MQPCGRRLLGGGAAPPPVSAGLGSGHSMDRAQRAHMERVLGVTTTVLFVASVSYIALTALYACFCDGGGARRDDDGAARDSSSVPPEPSEETKRALKGIPVHVVVHLARDADEETSSMEEGGGDCAVCLAEYAAGDEVRVLPACRHGFHRECVDRWLLTRAPTCPVCRAPVVARVEGTDAKEDCGGDGDGEAVERRGGGGIGFLSPSGGSRVLPAILP